MSKHKNFHNIKTPMQMLQHGRRNAIGPLYHWEPKKKRPPPVLLTPAAAKRPSTAPKP